MADSVFTPEQEARINDLLVEYLQQNGASIDAGVNVTELTGDALTDENLKKLTIPSILPNTNQWAYTSLQNMMVPIQHAIANLQTEDAQVQATILSATTATQSANTAAANADAKAELADTAADEAENVNATIVGTIFTVTNRNGESTSINVGFEIYRTYESITAMNADAANVPEGKFVIIATVDPTSADNAKMYVKNSQGEFTFVCDIDQASSAAWADWLNNMKPVIEQATTDANTATDNANSKATLAGNEADRAKNMNDHPAYIGEDDYWYFWDYTNQRYVKGEYARGAAATIVVGSTTTLDADQPATVVNSGTEGAAVFNFGIPRGVKGEDGQKGDKGDKGDDLDYSTMTEEEKSELNDTIVQHIVSENILGPTYDEADHGFDFPAAMHVQWDAVNHGFDI